MYRAVTLYSIENGIFQGDRIDAEKLKSLIKDIHISFRLNPETGRPDTYLNGVNVENKIRTMEVSSRVSPIATLDFVHSNKRWARPRVSLWMGATSALPFFRMPS
jgi:cytidylate kinase